MFARHTAHAVLAASTLLFACGGGDEVAEAGTAEDTSASELVQPSEWWNVHPRPVYATLEKVGTYQEWFDVYKLAEGTYAIYEPNQFEEAICYLVEGSEHAVLIDAGTGIGDLKAVVEDLTDLPVTLLLTHEHYDHVGSAHQFDEIIHFDNADALAVLAAGRDNASLQGYLTPEYLWKPLPEGWDADAWSIPPITPDQLLEDGDVVELGGRELEVIYTPGHSPGQICLLDRANRLLWTGDHFFAGPLYAHASDVDLDAYLESNRRLAEMVDAYDYLLGGHNSPWVDSEIIPRITTAFETIFAGGGEFSEGEGLRRYRFDGFDVLIRTESVMERM